MRKMRHAITSKSTTDGRASQRTLQSNLDSDAESTYLPSENTSDRKQLKTKYTDQKKRRARRVKTKRDMKKNPNKYHKKKSDPGVPNNAPFKLAILDEREAHLKQKQQEKDLKREKILKARKAMRETEVGGKRKLTDIINFDAGDDNNSDNENTKPNNRPNANERPKKLRKNNDSKAVPIEEDMELDDEERARRNRSLAQAKKLARLARQQHYEFRNKHHNAKNVPNMPDPDPRFHNWSDKVYYRQVKQVVDAADVLLQVIDARDPLGTRCAVLENVIRSRPGKRLVLVLNKADLVPKSNLEAWLNYLRAEAPTVAFKAATRQPNKYNNALHRMVHIGEESLRTPKSMGCDVLMQLLKNYARSFGGLGIVAGVVGLPNVGKSSLINSLKKVKTCQVAPMPGCTKNIKEIRLDAKLRLLDCPGVVLPGEDMSPIDAALRNLVKLESIRNAVDVALEIFRRSDSLKLALFYGVRKVDDGEQFLSLLAKKSKQMLKHGISNQEAAAKKLIYDWNHGILKYYTEVPKREESAVSTEVVTKLSPEFDLDNTTYKHEEAFMSFLHDGRPSVTMSMPAGAPVQTCLGLDENAVQESEEEEEEEDVVVGATEEDDEEIQMESDDEERFVDTTQGEPEEESGEEDSEPEGEVDEAEEEGDSDSDEDDDDDE